MFGSKFVKFFMWILKRLVNSSSNFASFFFVITHNSSENFKLIHFLVWIKGFHQNCSFETFKCSGENLPYSSYHFPEYKSFFLQILHHSSVSWEITPLYLFRLNVVYKIKRTNQNKHFENFKCSGQNSPNSCYIWNNKSLFLQILHHSSASWDVTPLYLFSLNFPDILSTKGAYQSTNLVNFLMNSRKSVILCLDGFLLSKPYKVWAKKVQKSYLTWHWRVIKGLEKNWLVVSNMTWEI